MTRKSIFSLFAMLFVAGLVFTSALKNEARIAEAKAAPAMPAAAFGLCETPFVKNIQIKSLGKSDFEVTWEYAPPDPCLQPKEFKVVVEARRKIGGTILGTDRITAKASDRRAVGKFASLLGFDLVTATVTPMIELAPRAVTGSINL